jgi:hypothetical protein
MNDIYVKDIVRLWLEENSYDGLFYIEGDGCACLLGDLIPCNAEWAFSCIPGVKKECSGNCGFDETHDFHIIPKPKK